MLWLFQFSELEKENQQCEKALLTDGIAKTTAQRELYEKCLKLKTTVSITLQRVEKIDCKKASNNKKKETLVKDIEHLLV